MKKNLISILYQHCKELDTYWYRVLRLYHWDDWSKSFYEKLSSKHCKQMKPMHLGRKSTPAIQKYNLKLPSLLIRSPQDMLLQQWLTVFQMVHSISKRETTKHAINDKNIHMSMHRQCPVKHEYFQYSSTSSTSWFFCLMLLGMLLFVGS